MSAEFRIPRVVSTLVLVALTAVVTRASSSPSAQVTTETTDGSRPGVPATTWRTLRAANGQVKIWVQAQYPQELATAQTLASEMTNRIWPTLVGLFWAPLHDDFFDYSAPGGGTRKVENLDDTGGGPELDIYLVHEAVNTASAVDLGGESHAAYRSYTCGQNPRYITLESRRPLGGNSGSGILNTAAHEFMHAIDQATPWLNDDCNKYHWIDEATATWSEHRVYKDGQSEHMRAIKFLSTVNLPLDFEISPSDERHYGLYLFPFDLQLHDKESAVKAMWLAFGSEKPLRGINAALGSDGLSKFFPTFMLDNWNRPPVDDYKTKDGLIDGARVDEDKNPQVVTGPEAIPMPSQVRYLSATYRYFKFGQNVRAVTFDNDLNGHPDVSIWALEKIDGQWKKEEFSHEPGKTWCRDLQGEDIEELVLAFGNTSWPKTPAQEGNLTSLIIRGKPILTTFATGCNAWVGTTSATFQSEGDGVVIKETADAHVRFVLNTDMNVPGNPPEYWKAVSGSILWTATASGKCTGKFSGTIPIEIDAAGNLPAVLDIEDRDEGKDPSGKRILRYTGSIGPWDRKYDPNFSWDCGGPEKLATGLNVAWTWFQTDPTGQKITEGTAVLTGSWSLPNANPAATMRWTWTLHISP